jgi:hypothetical protein
LLLISLVRKLINENRLQLKAIPLSVEHVIDNEDEALRLAHLGVDVDTMSGALAPQGYTRCLGSHRYARRRNSGPNLTI